MATALVFRFQRAPLVTPGLQLVREGRPPKTGPVGSPFGCSHLCLGHRRSYLGLFRDIFFRNEACPQFHFKNGITEFGYRISREE